MDILVGPNLVIKANEIHWRFSRSSGSGGQNVNKTDSRVEIVFNVKKSKSLSSYQKSLILDQYKSKLINGCICIAVQEKRTQFHNRKLALNRLAGIISNVLSSTSKKRIATKPTRSSQRKRIESKKKRSEIKKNRQLNNKIIQ